MTKREVIEVAKINLGSSLIFLKRLKHAQSQIGIGEKLQAILMFILTTQDFLCRDT